MRVDRSVGLKAYGAVYVIGVMSIKAEKILDSSLVFEIQIAYKLEQKMEGLCDYSPVVKQLMMMPRLKRVRFGRRGLRGDVGHKAR